MDYIIGIDGGATSTKATAYNLTGNVLYQTKSGYSNVLINPKIALENIRKVIDECLNQLINHTCVYLYLGIAGINSGTVKSELEMLLSAYNISYEVTSDAVIAHAASLQGKDGIMVLAGTGSVIYAKKKDNYQMAGGWGHLLGDEGSGYWIVIEYLKKCIQQYEKNQHIPKLCMVLLEKMQVENLPAIKGFIYTKSKAEIADFAQIIVEFINPDPFVEEIITKAAQHLAETTINLYNKMEFTYKLNIGFKGSIMLNVEIIKDIFKKEIAAAGINAKYFEDEDASTKGAFYLAKKNLET